MGSSWVFKTSQTNAVSSDDQVFPLVHPAAQYVAAVYKPKFETN